MTDAFDATLGLGSNIGDKADHIRQAIRLIDAMPGIRVVARSGLYRSAPWGKTDQDWFVNACVGISTTLAPREVLRRCQEVEGQLRRVRQERWGPRTIDVDILTWRDLEIAEPELVVPHPRLTERGFVLVPLAEIAATLVVRGKTVAAWLDAIDARDVVPFDAPAAG